MDLEKLRLFLLQNPGAAPAAAMALKELLPIGEAQAQGFALIDEILHGQKPIRGSR